MAQVFRNLLSNAIKFTPIDGIVYVHTQLRDGSFEVSVRDNGTGISAENQSKLFANVIQFNARVQQGGGGSGLGLWISS